MNLPESREKSTLVEINDEITISPIFNKDEAKRFVNFLEIYKKENDLNQIYIRIPGSWHSDNESRKILFEYLKEQHDYVIIETSPVLRAYFKTELTMRKGDPEKILKERK